MPPPCLILGTEARGRFYTASGFALPNDDWRSQQHQWHTNQAIDNHNTKRNEKPAIDYAYDHSQQHPPKRKEEWFKQAHSLREEHPKRILE